MRVTTVDDSRSLVYFPFLDTAMPLEEPEQIEAFRARFGPGGSLHPGAAAPCIVNPAYSEKTCTSAPTQAGSDCDVLHGASPSCTACVNRVLLGTQREVDAFVWARTGIFLLAVSMLILCFLPVGLYSLVYARSLLF